MKEDHEHDRSSPSTGRLFNKLGRAGRAPGRGYRNTAGTNPGDFNRNRPTRGYGMSKSRRHPKKGPKP